MLSLARWTAHRNRRRRLWGNFCIPVSWGAQDKHFYTRAMYIILIYVQSNARIYVHINVRTCNIFFISYLYRCWNAPGVSSTHTGMFIMRNENAVRTCTYRTILYYIYYYYSSYYLSSLNKTHVYHFYSLSFGENREVNIFFSTINRARSYTKVENGETTNVKNPRVPDVSRTTNVTTTKTMTITATYYRCSSRRRGVSDTRNTQIR